MISDYEDESFTGVLTWFPTSSARLAYFGTIRDSYTGLYMQEKRITKGDGGKGMHRLLRTAHEKTFRSVIELPIWHLCRELKEYLRSLSGLEQEEKTAAVWLDLEPYLDMIPQGCSAFDRQLFQARMRAALQIVINVPDCSLVARPLSTTPTSLKYPPPGRRFLRHRDN